jgi:hypothetical protein
MPMNWITHTAFITIVAVLPLISMSSMRKLKRFADFGRLPDLTLNNLFGALVLWLCALGVFMAWMHQGGSMESMGLVKPSVSAWLTSIIIVVFALLFVTWSAWRIRSHPTFRRGFIDSMEYVIAILPRTRRERNSFYLLSVTAGICEEIIYRGFVFAYLLSYMELAMVVIVSSLLFGIAHTYQGFKGVPQTGLIGLALALLYVFTGSLLAPMVLHAAIDLGYGYLGWLALQQGDEE